MNTTLPSPATQTATTTSIGNLAKIMGVGTAIAAIATGVTFAIAEAVSTELLVAGADGEPAVPVTIGEVVGGTIVAAIVGILFAIGLHKFVPNSAAKIFTGTSIALVVALGVFAFTAADNTTTGIWLNVLHIVAAIPVIGAAVRGLSTSPTR